MHPANEQKILGLLRPTDIVLDIGGWACPFNRANYVLDAQPYETRGFYKTVGLPASQGGDREHFTADTWVCRDICDKAPFPFADKQFDFVICSHTLEDIRDPLWVCAEMVRVGKRGYIEVPSRVAETCRGWESPRIAGLSHHRWLIDIDEAGPAVWFLMKYHAIHAHWRFSLPPSYLRSLTAEQKVSWLFWEDSFAYSEATLHGMPGIEAELAGFVSKTHPYPRWRLMMADARSAAARVLSLPRRLLRAKGS